MFTGIVQELAPVVRITFEPGLARLELALSATRRKGLEGGASVAVNGTCLTVSGFSAETVAFDVIAETLERTSLGGLVVGDRVNVERSATFADEIGGHRVSGHVSGTAPITQVRSSDNNRVLRFAGSADWMRFIFHKGYVALDGASLTISSLDRAGGWFEVSLIPETLARTTFGARAEGDVINVEVDSETQTIVETVERLFEDPDWRRQVLPADA